MYGCHLFFWFLLESTCFKGQPWVSISTVFHHHWLCSYNPRHCNGEGCVTETKLCGRQQLPPSDPPPLNATLAACQPPRRGPLLTLRQRGTGKKKRQQSTVQTSMLMKYLYKAVSHLQAQVRIWPFHNVLILNYSQRALQCCET